MIILTRKVNWIGVIFLFLYIHVFGFEISCSSDSIITSKDELITPIECLDDSSVHSPLSISTIPLGLQFDGKTISGKITEPLFNYFLYVYNNVTSYQITINVMDTPLFLHYGVSSQTVYLDTEMLPLYPRSNTYLDSYVLQSTLLDGLYFDNKTGAIWGKPTYSTTFKSITLKITGSNPFGSVSTQLILVLSTIGESFEQGAEVCFVPTEIPSSNPLPSLFLYSNLTCMKQSSFNWADSFDSSKNIHSNSLLSSVSIHGMIRVHSYFYNPYSTPTTFTLSSTSPLLLYLDHYQNPLFDTIENDSPTDRSVTIMLSSGFHHLIAYTTTYSLQKQYSYFSLFFSYHCYNQGIQLLSTNHLLFPQASPKDAFFPFAIGFEGIPLVLTIQTPYPLTRFDALQIPDSLAFLSASQIMDRNPVVGMASYNLRLKNEHGERYYSGSYRIEKKVEGILVTVSEVTVIDYDQLKLGNSVWEYDHSIVYQHQVPSFLSFTADEIPISIVASLIEYNTTLIIEEVNEYYLNYDNECEVFLDGSFFKRNSIYQSFIKNEYLSVYMRCTSIQSTHQLILEKAILSNTESEVEQTTIPSISFFHPLSSFSFEYPTYHCVMNEPCPINSLRSLPDNCTLVINPSLPDGFSLSSTGVLSAQPQSYMEKAEYTISCEDSYYETTLSLLVSDTVLPPSSITLTTSSSVIEKEIALSLGVSFFIGITIDYAIGTEIDIIPPLPSSIIVTPSYLAGNLTQPINGNYTIQAKNKKGVFTRDLYIYTDSEPSIQYYLHILTGKGIMRATVNDETIVDRLVYAGSYYPFTAMNETLKMQYTCRYAEGCWFTIESINMRLPSIYLHYGESYQHQYTLPLLTSSVTPILTNAVGILHQPIPTLIWEQEGFFSDVILHDLPSWISYNPLENRLEGIAEEVGDFIGSVEIITLSEQYEFAVNFTIIDTFSLFANETMIHVVCHNDNHSSLLPSFNAIDDIIEVEEFSLQSFSHSLITIDSYLLLTHGLHNFTLSKQDVTRIDFYQDTILLITRKAKDLITYFYTDIFVHEDEDWLVYDSFDPVGIAWTTLFYDDNIWKEEASGWMEVEEQESFYLRKHFYTTIQQWTSLAMILELNVGAEVYVNGRFIRRIEVTEGCNQKLCQQQVTHHFIQPQVYSFTVDIGLDENLQEGIIAIHLFSYYPSSTSFFFKATVFPILTSTQLSNLHTPVSRSTPIIPNESDPQTLVIPYTPYSFSNSILPSSVTLSLDYPSSLSHFYLYSSAISFTQIPSYLIIWGQTTEGKQVLLGQKNHPLLWSASHQPLIIHLDSSYLLTQVTLTIYSTDYEGNHAHYYGAIELYSQDHSTCSKEGSYPERYIGEYAVVNIVSEIEKGYSIRYCNKRVNDTNPLIIYGLWSSEQKQIVKKVPNRGYAFVEFMLIFHGINVDVGYILTPEYLESLYEWIFEQEKLQHVEIQVYRIEDRSKPYDSTFNYFLQVKCHTKQANTIKNIISTTIPVVISELISLHPTVYPSTLDIILNGNPTIIIKPKELWEIILEISIWVVVISSICIILWIYRKEIKKWYNRVSNAYRMRRRQAIFEEFGLPINMYYNPKEPELETTIASFETPYGDIHLVRPLIQLKQKEKRDFIIAEDL